MYFSCPWTPLSFATPTLKPLLHVGFQYAQKRTLDRKFQPIDVSGIQDENKLQYTCLHYSTRRYTCRTVFRPNSKRVKSWLNQHLVRKRLYTSSQLGPILDYNDIDYNVITTNYSVEIKIIWLQSLLAYNSPITHKGAKGDIRLLQRHAF